MNSGRWSSPGGVPTRRGVRPRVAERYGALATVSLLGALAALHGAVFAREAFAQEAFALEALAEEGLSEGGTGVSSDLAPSDALTERPGTELAAGERVDRGKELVAGIERSAQSIQRQLQSARRDRDVVRVLCLNDKLNQVDVALRTAQDRASALNAAAERNDADRSRHEYTVLEVLSDRVRALVNESSQCIGEETGFVGEAEVSVSIDPNLPAGDTGFGAETYALPAPPNISSPIE